MPVSPNWTRCDSAGQGTTHLSTVALAITCKTPMSGASKTRLSPPLRPNECAAISACFIRDLARTIAALAKDGDVTGYALYTPRGSEASLLPLMPNSFKLMPQVDAGFGDRLLHGTIDLLAAGHSGAILVNSDSRRCRSRSCAKPPKRYAAATMSSSSSRL